ncbi:NAD(P)-binding domain-containing protein [Methylocystis echinoides]|uniref:Pyridine nucleotide-disulfide oxidoreductase n=1 Tax=Methylocystis echinoides TaxID=29468 RepID=A0A9W6GWS0_9HYPH|nr:NAD(P)-binding domain-containing protein [Methylocystis echinoides]GLI94541.1 pyridine nucleotide-disulfide oxidoreductase [Methylocystis echinoides]
MQDVSETEANVILGAGPAGLQLAYYFKKFGLPYIVLERDASAGSFFRRYPRHRKLLSINKTNVAHESRDYRMRHDWNSLLEDADGRFPDFSSEYFPPADALVDYLADFARRHDLAIRYNCNVSHIERAPGARGFTLRTDQGAALSARRLVVATGLSLPYAPSFEGAELVEGYEDMSVRPEDFAGLNVLIIGKGNSALETANALLGSAARIHLISPRPVRFAWDTHHAGNVRSINNAFFDSYLLKSLNGVIDAEIEWIRRRADGRLAVRFMSIHASDDSETLVYDRVLRCAGFAFDPAIFAADCRPALTCGGRLPDISGDWASRNVPDLYFAGALMQALDYKRSQSSFIRGFRYNIRSLATLLAVRSGAISMPQDEAPAEAEALAGAILSRLEVTDSLWQQVGFLCDVIVRPACGASRTPWYRDLNPFFIEEGGVAAMGHDDVYAVMLGYGPRTGTAFDHPHLYPPSVDPRVFGDQSTEIHPVVRRYRQGRLEWEFHLRSEFLSQWNNPARRGELRDFLSRDLADGGPGAIAQSDRARQHAQ